MQDYVVNAVSTFTDAVEESSVMPRLLRRTLNVRGCVSDYYRVTCYPILGLCFGLWISSGRAECGQAKQHKATGSWLAGVDAAHPNNDRNGRRFWQQNVFVHLPLSEACLLYNVVYFCLVAKAHFSACFVVFVLLTGWSVFRIWNYTRD